MQRLYKYISSQVPFLVIGTLLCTIIDSLFYIFVENKYDRGILVIGANFMMTLGMVLILMLLSVFKAALRVPPRFLLGKVRQYHRQGNDSPYQRH